MINLLGRPATLHASMPIPLKRRSARSTPFRASWPSPVVCRSAYGGSLRLGASLRAIQHRSNECGEYARNEPSQESRSHVASDKQDDATHHEDDEEHLLLDSAVPDVADVKATRSTPA